MGFFSEIKKLFFASKSVAKHQAEKGIDYGLEQGSELANKGKDALGDLGGVVSSKASGLRDAVVDKSGDALNTVKDAAGSTYDALADNEMVKKAGDFAEDVGGQVIEKGGQLMDKAGDLSETVGAKVLDVKDDMVEKAKEFTDKMGDKFDETLEKAKAFEAEEALKPKREFAEDTIDASGSLLEGKDDFFAKADRYADGEYGAFSEGKTTISKPDNLELPEKPTIKAAGFEDADGDGNEIIDDAVIVEDDSTAEAIVAGAAATGVDAASDLIGAANDAGEEKPMLLDDGEEE